jgi:AcrR family transcriptional regulator
MFESERILQLRDAVGQRPWNEVSLEELARAAGISRMTLHRHGVGRDEILTALGELLASEHSQAALPALTSLAPAPQRLAMALRAKLEVDERYLGLMEALQHQLPAVYHEQGDGEVLTRGPFIDGIKRILQDGAVEGTLAAQDNLDEAATLIFNATGWTYREMRNGHRWPPQKARERVVELLMHGVMA